MQTTAKSNKPYWIAIAIIFALAAILAIKQANAQGGLQKIKDMQLLQKQKDRKLLAVKCACMMVSGAFDGTAESLKFHYDRFNNRFPGNEQFWNPAKSWPNKYKNGDPAQGPAFFGSTTFLVGATDGYHLTRTLRNTFMVAGVSIPLYGKRPWYDYLLQAVLYYASYTIGFSLVYDVFFFEHR